MARIVLLNIFMFLLPFLVYAAYLYLVRDDDAETDYWREAPIKWLFVIGLVLVVVGLMSLISFSGGGPEGTYEPPTVEDGEIVPGRIK